MSKAIVIYTSKRGSTKQYAEWIAEDLGCGAVPLSDVLKSDITFMITAALSTEAG